MTIVAMEMQPGSLASPSARRRCFAEKYISIAAYRQRHDRNPNSNGHAGPGQCGGGAERRARADPRPWSQSGNCLSH